MSAGHLQFANTLTIPTQRGAHMSASFGLAVAKNTKYSFNFHGCFYSLELHYTQYIHDIHVIPSE